LEVASIGEEEGPLGGMRGYTRGVTYLQPFLTDLTRRGNMVSSSGKEKGRGNLPELHEGAQGFGGGGGGGGVLRTKDWDGDSHERRTIREGTSIRTVDQVETSNSLSSGWHNYGTSKIPDRMRGTPLPTVLT